jgi:hypothetical protein
MDVNKLMNALDNEKNEILLGLTNKKINEINYNIIKQLHLGKEVTIDYLKKLKGYRYIDEVQELRYGSYLRWIPISDPNYLPLHYAGIICDIKITDTGIILVCKNFMHRHYTFKMDECLIFQKLSEQEKVLLSALDHLDREKEDEDEN